MTTHRDSTIRAWQMKAGLKPATGEQDRLLRELSEAAYELIRMIELERSGIRDGDGCWTSSYSLHDTILEIGKLFLQYDVVLERERRVHIAAENEAKARFSMPHEMSDEMMPF
jgi:hypothetical protein